MNDFGLDGMIEDPILNLKPSHQPRKGGH